MTTDTWRDRLHDHMDPDWAQEIDDFEAQLELRRQGSLDEKAFAETRLRRGVYGQRYDNGKRNDGFATRELPLDMQHPTKGTDTVWDAPGMQRIKLPFGGLSPDQLDVIADLAEEYSDEILHVTTRQDFQLHFVHIDDTPDLMRRLAAVGVTTREACGNSIRNVTACPLAGVCHTEAFDVSPYAKALMLFLLGHPDVQDFGRKFKPAFSGCEAEACGLVQFHDAGYVARIKDGKRGFKVVVGGGLGTVPHQAEVLSEFTPVEDFLVEIQAIARVFARLGEKKNRNRARIKFLVANLGIDEFRRLVEEEKATIPPDLRHTGLIEDLPTTSGPAVRDPAKLNGQPRPDGFDTWHATNIYRQRQEGYCTVTVNLPLGDLTSQQARGLADVSRRFAGDNMRTTVDQNIVLRFVAEADLPAVFADLEELGLANAGAGTITDVVACPGTDTCKLGIASSRGLAGVVKNRLEAKAASLDQSVSDMSVKISGCFNSCGQHHIADVGFYGNARGVDGRRVPHFQVVLGGQRKGNAAKYGMAVGAVPSKAAPEVLDALTDAYLAGREDGESFQDWSERMGKRGLRDLIQPFMDVPNFDEDPSFYVDHADARLYSMGDLGVGECAGEVVSLFGIEVMKAESEVFDAQVALDEDDDAAAAERHAYQAMLAAARALVRTEHIDVSEDPDDIVSEWKARFFDTERFFDRFARGKFGRYLLDRHADPAPSGDRATAARRVEEAQLFLEAAHSCEARIAAEKAAIAESKEQRRKVEA
ncbi:MAG: nitrite/sulfite reductase [Nitriliruptorales bacterium]|nr:nitrite/sulfite reductase [Nitriliruptorales bacterium]